MTESLVLDNVVLSGFYTAGWFDCLAFWKPEYKYQVPEIIWIHEFDPHHEYGNAPNWLELVQIEENYEFENPGTLSLKDWCCLILAKQNPGTLITRDRKLKQTAKEKGVSTMWAGRFVLDTFEECGISEEEYNSGIDDYLHDAHIPSDVEESLKQAEKPD